jgi:hypothetical protein
MEPQFIAFHFLVTKHVSAYLQAIFRLIYKYNILKKLLTFNGSVD